MRDLRLTAAALEHTAAGLERAHAELVLVRPALHEAAGLTGHARLSWRLDEVANDLDLRLRAAAELLAGLATAGPVIRDSFAAVDARLDGVASRGVEPGARG